MDETWESTDVKNKTGKCNYVVLETFLFTAYLGSVYQVKKFTFLTNCMGYGLKNR